MRAKDGKVTAYKSTQKTGGGHYGNYDRHTGNLYQYNHKDSGGGHMYVNIATGREGYHGPDYEKNATRWCS